MKNKVIFSGIVVLSLFTLVGCNSLASNSNNGKTANTLTTTEPTTKPGSNGTSLTGHKNGFDFSKYLPFTPLLPSYTAGYQLTHSEITRYLNTGQNGNAISYSASYSTAFSLIEGRPHQLHIAPSLNPKTNVTLSNNIHASIYTYDGGESIEFINNGLLYDLTTTNGVSLQELEKVCTSISVPASVAPNDIHVSDNGARSASVLSFSSVRVGQFYVPKGYSLNVQGSAINISGTSKQESFQITYRKGSSYLTITQSTGSEPDYTQGITYHNVKIQGVSVLEQSSNSMEPKAFFTIPQTNVHVVVYSNISSREVSKVVNSFLSTVMHTTTH